MHLEVDVEVAACDQARDSFSGSVHTLPTGLNDDGLGLRLGI